MSEPRAAQFLFQGVKLPKGDNFRHEIHIFGGTEFRQRWMIHQNWDDGSANEDKGRLQGAHSLRHQSHGFNRRAHGPVAASTPESRRRVPWRVRTAGHPPKPAAHKSGRLGAPLQRRNCAAGPKHNL